MVYLEGSSKLAGEIGDQVGCKGSNDRCDPRWILRKLVGSFDQRGFLSRVWRFGVAESRVWVVA